jgi:SET domain-containing protein
MSRREPFEVATSSIHGRGVFARQRFRKGTYIGTFEGRETDCNGTHVLWVYDEDDREYGVEGENELRFLNHSARPNAEFRGLDLHALGTIEAGHEITFDYGEEWEGEG